MSNKQKGSGKQNASAKPHIWKGQRLNLSQRNPKIQVPAQSPPAKKVLCLC